ncbi:MAG: YhfC family intramembrane metalloprotease [Lachnospiraceae bacterium]|nr:YhfC family intramembrane metalloprotease [Lachnospiraceae bacterium]MBQ3906904.1 YhfC family intramembrane metalloprotease [Lachnospiraceae bacterium]
MEFAKVGTSQMLLLVVGTVLFIAVPLIIAILWTKKKKEKFSTILVGAATFILFAILLEKPIQNILVFPTLMGLSEHAASKFINARPILWALIVGLFPGVFEETGRLVAFKTVLRKRQNRETSISHGIGHGGIEVILILGLTYVTYISYAFMINSGTFGTMIEQMATQAPDQVSQGYAIAEQLATFSVGDLVVNIIERIFAFMYHTGASMLVFYACRDKKRFWLYPLAILLHAMIDGFAGLQLAGVISVSTVVTEIVIAVSGSLTFFGAYFLLYKKDADKELA